MLTRKSSGNVKSSKIKVVCVVHPSSTPDSSPLDEFSIHNHSNCLKIGSDSFSFDRVFGYDATHDEVFETTVLPLVDTVLTGCNASVFVYGQTSEGKVKTMEGDCDREIPITDSSKKGILPRTAFAFFKGLQMANPEIKFLIRVSFVEIYMESVYDLLDKKQSRENLRILTDETRNIYVEDCTEVVVHNGHELLEAIAYGTSNRQTLATGMNEATCRGHAILTISVEQSNTKTLAVMTYSKLVFIDLAGSETSVSKGNVSGQQLREANSINQSLTAFGQVILELQTNAEYVSYRNSKLTRLTQDSLGGNSRTVFIVICSPSNAARSDVISTLRFGTKAKNIESSLAINHQPRSIDELEVFVSSLQQSLDDERHALQKLTRKFNDCDTKLQTEIMSNEEMKQHIWKIQKIITTHATSNSPHSPPTHERVNPNSNSNNNNSHSSSAGGGAGAGGVGVTCNASAATTHSGGGSAAGMAGGTGTTIWETRSRSHSGDNISMLSTNSSERERVDRFSLGDHQHSSSCPDVTKEFLTQQLDFLVTSQMTVSNAYKRKIGDLEAKLVHSGVVLNQAVGQSSLLIQQVEELNIQLEAVTQKESRTASLLADKQSELEAANRELIELQRRNIELEERLQQRDVELEERLQRVSLEKEDTSKQLSSLLHQLSECSSALEYSQKEITNLTTLNTLVTAEKMKLESDIQEANVRIGSLEQQLSVSFSVIQRLKGDELTTAAIALQTEQEKNNQLHNQLKELQAITEKLSQEKNILEADLLDSKIVIQKCESLMNNLTLTGSGQSLENAFKAVTPRNTSRSGSSSLHSPDSSTSSPSSTSSMVPNSPIPFQISNGYHEYSTVPSTSSPNFNSPNSIPTSSSAARCSYNRPVIEQIHQLIEQKIQLEGRLKRLDEDTGKLTDQKLFYEIENKSLKALMETERSRYDKELAELKYQLQLSGTRAEDVDSSLQDTLRDLRDARAQLLRVEDEYEQLLLKTRKYERSNEDLTRDLNDTTTELDRQTSLLVAAQSRLAQNEKDMKGLRDENTNLTRNADNITQKYEELQLKSTRQVERILELEVHSKDLQDIQNSLLSKMESSGCEIEKLNLEITALKCGYNDKLMDWDAERCKLQDKLQQQLKLNDELQAECKHQSNVMEVMQREAIMKSEEMETMSEHIRSETSRTNKLLEEMKALRDSLERTVLEKMDLNGHSQDLQLVLQGKDNQIMTLKTQIQQLEEEHLLLRTKSDKLMVARQVALCEKDAALEEKSNCQEKISDLEARLSVLIDVKAKLEGELETLNKQFLAETDNVTRLNNELQHQLNSYAKLLTLMEGIQQENLKLQSETANRSVDLEKERSRVNDVRNEIASTQQRNNELKMKLQDLEIVNNNLSAERKLLLSHIQEIKDNANSSEQQLSTALSEVLQLNEKINKLQFELQKTNQTKDFSQQRIIKLESDLSSTSSKLEHLEQMRIKEQKEFSDKILSLQEVVINMQNQFDKKHKTALELENKLTDAHQSMTMMRLELSTATFEKNEFNAQVNTLTNYIESQTAEMSMLQQDLLSANLRNQETLDTLSKERGLTDEYRNKAAELELMISAMISDRAQLQTDISKYDKLITVLQTESKQNELLLEDLKEQKRVLELEIIEMNTVSEENIEVINLLEENNKKLLEQSTALQLEKETALMRILSQNEQIDEMKKRQLELEGDVFSYETKLAQAKKTVQDLEVRPTELRAVVEEREFRIAELERNLVASQTKMHAAVQARESSETRMALLRDEVDDLKRQLVAVSDARAADNRRLSGVLQQLQAETTRADSLHSRVKVLSSALANLSNEKSALQVQVQVAIQEKKDLLSRIQNLQPSEG